MSADPVRLIGIYDADGSLLGEVSYWVGARLGQRHCALCQITHGLVREKRQWRDCRSDLKVPFKCVHRDEISPELAAIVKGRAPCVVAEWADGSLEIVIDREQLEACDGRPERLAVLIEGRL